MNTRETQEYDRLIALANRLDRGDESARAPMAQILRDEPGAWKLLGNFAKEARTQLLSNSAVKQPAVIMGAEAGIREMGEQLGYDTAPMLEKLLIQQILLCHLDHYLDQMTRANLGRAVLAQCAYWDKRVSQSQGRYLRACEALARVRKLSAKTPLQINIGGQQINVAGQGEAVNIPAGPGVLPEPQTLDQLIGPAHKRNRARRDS